MKFIVNIRNSADLDVISGLDVSRVLVQAKGYSRFGGIDFEELPGILKDLAKRGKKSVLAWDALLCESEKKSQLARISPLFSNIDSVRFLDPGVGKLVQSKHPGINLEISLEHGSLNKPAVLGWIGLFKPSIRTVVLSGQLTLQTIKSMRAEIPVDIEILGFGPMEMFYSGRQLMTGLLAYGTSGETVHEIASKDRPAQLNQICQSDRGTIVFYDKLLNILDLQGHLEEAGINFIRFEYQNQRQLNRIVELLKGCDSIPASMDWETGNQSQGFILENRSNRHFAKLTNRFLKTSIEKKAGEILESVKNSYTVMRLDRELELPHKLLLISPEGKRVETELNKVQDLKGKSFSGHLKPGIYRLEWIKFAVSGTLITHD